MSVSARGRVSPWKAMRMRAVLALFLLSAVACRGQFDVSGRVDPNSIREYLHELTRRPHLAGSDRDRELAEWVGANFESSGLDRVQGDKYHVLLSRPNPDRPNKIRLVDGDGRVMFTSQHREEVRICLVFFVFLHLICEIILPVNF